MSPRLLPPGFLWLRGLVKVHQVLLHAGRHFWAEAPDEDAAVGGKEGR